MRYRMYLLTGVLMMCLLGISLPASAYYDTHSYRLERTRIHGYVESVDDQVCYVRTDEGPIIAVQLGPESYWRMHHYYMPEDQYVDMVVWYDPTEDYTDWCFAGEISGPNFDFELTNHWGVPLWVTVDDDYYYHLGYRASCVSYMVWYDCPPVYFVNLSLPPPPPRTYTVYYGSQWSTHRTDWQYGARFTSGGTYWQSTSGYQPAQRIIGRRGYEPGRIAGSKTAGNSAGGGRERIGRPVPASSAPAPMMKQPPRNQQMQKKPEKQEKPGRGRQRSEMSPGEQNNDRRHSGEQWAQPTSQDRQVKVNGEERPNHYRPYHPTERGVYYSPASEPQTPQAQPRPENQPRKEYDRPNTVRQQPQQQQIAKPQANRQQAPAQQQQNAKQKAAAKKKQNQKQPKQ